MITADQLPFGALTYKKGLPNEVLRNELYAIMDERTATFDCASVDNILRAQMKQVGDNCAPFIAVDPDIFAMKGAIRQAPPEPDATELIQAMHQLMQLQTLRDLPLRDLPDDEALFANTKGLKQLSWFLKDKEIQTYARSVNYLTNEESWIVVQAGRKPLERLQLGPVRTVETGRDMAALVHTDNPITEAIAVIASLRRLGVASRVPAGFVEGAVSNRFTCFGDPWLMGRIGNLVSLVGLESFTNKWTLRIARPEELAVAFHMGYLSQCFPEGSPYHPSMNAMHAYVYYALAGWINFVFDEYHVLPNGAMVRDEVDLWAANYADGRMWAGVHTWMDNWPFYDAATKLGTDTAAQDLQIMLTS